AECIPSDFMGPRIGLFTYATKVKGGVADFDYLYLSDTSRDEPVTDEKLQSIIGFAQTLVLDTKPCEYQENVAFWMKQAKEASERGVFTHPQADAPVERLQLAIAEFLAADDRSEDRRVGRGSQLS